MKRITMFCDGLCEPNPGVGCSAYVAFEEDVRGGQRDLRAVPLVEQYACIGQNVTNNDAEYRAVVGALKWAVKNVSQDDVVIRTDSQLVVNQINGSWACNKDHLRVHRDEARTLMRELLQVRLEWVRRDDNWVADRLTRIAYREAMGRDVPERAKYYGNISRQR